MKKLWKKIREWIREWIDEQDAAIDAARAARGDDAAASPGESSTSDEVAVSTPAAPSADEVAFDNLEWRWGGFKGTKAVLADGVRIKGLKVSGSGMSYSWAEGGCEGLDRNCSHDNPCCTCALFCLLDGKWVGGKFEHVSTDRRTRGFANILWGYGGWDASALSQATSYAFVILDDGGRRRTNVITCGR